MNWISWLILIVVIVAVIASLYHMIKKPGCGCSSGSCQGCSKSCCAYNGKKSTK